MDKMNKVFDWMDGQMGPDKTKYPKACLEAREMVMDCVIHSDCMKVGGNEQEIRKFQVLHAGGYRQALQGASL